MAVTVSDVPARFAAGVINTAVYIKKYRNPKARPKQARKYLFRVIPLKSTNPKDSSAKTIHPAAEAAEDSRYTERQTATVKNAVKYTSFRTITPPYKVPH